MPFLLQDMPEKFRAKGKKLHFVFVDLEKSFDMVPREVIRSVMRTSIDIGGDANLELVDKFCYLGDMLSVDGDADAAVETRI